MATVIGNTVLTLSDWASRHETPTEMGIIVDLLSQANEILDDMMWIEGNQTSGHKTTVRTGLPTATWRMLYQGVQPTKSVTAQITESCGNLENYSIVDKDLADLNGNTSIFRLSEESAFFEGMGQQMAQALFYSTNISTPAQILGLSPRYYSVSTANALTAANVIDGGGTGSTNTSIWLVGWGANTCTGIFPRGKIGGLQHRDLGEQTQFNPDGSRFQVYNSHFKWEAGLCVRDWRYVARIANIDVTLLNGTNAANLINLLVRLTARFPTMGRKTANSPDPTKPSGVVGGALRPAIYVNRTIATALSLQAMNKTNVLLQMMEFDGVPVLMFRGIPVRIVDQLLSTEARLT